MHSFSRKPWPHSACSESSTSFMGILYGAFTLTKSRFSFFMFITTQVIRVMTVNHKKTNVELSNSCLIYLCLISTGESYYGKTKCACYSRLYAAIWLVLPGPHHSSILLALCSPFRHSKTRPAITDSQPGTLATVCGKETSDKNCKRYWRGNRGRSAESTLSQKLWRQSIRPKWTPIL